MGYNENQYSLPRIQDLSVSRQSVYDDTFRHIPTVGWMFVPISVYHKGSKSYTRRMYMCSCAGCFYVSRVTCAGGDAAMFMPLSEHIDEYEWALAQYLGAGVAACYRGPMFVPNPQLNICKFDV